MQPGGAFFIYSFNVASEAPLIVGPNYCSGESWGRYIYNPNNLIIDVRDVMMGAVTENPGSLAASSSASIGSVPVGRATPDDQFMVETSANMAGLLVQGYVSAHDTVALTLINQNDGAIDIGAIKFVARVRLKF